MAVKKKRKVSKARKTTQRQEKKTDDEYSVVDSVSRALADRKISGFILITSDHCWQGGDVTEVWFKDKLKEASDMVSIRIIKKLIGEKYSLDNPNVDINGRNIINGSTYFLD